MFEKIVYETSDLSERYKVALRLTDALVTRPDEITPALAQDVRRLFSPAEVPEIMADVFRNSCQKVVVALALDDAVVTDGVEYYDVDADGQIVYPDNSGPTTSWPLKTSRADRVVGTFWERYNEQPAAVESTLGIHASSASTKSASLAPAASGRRPRRISAARSGHSISRSPSACRGPGRPWRRVMGRAHCGASVPTHAGSCRRG